MHVRFVSTVVASFPARFYIRRVHHAQMIVLEALSV